MLKLNILSSLCALFSSLALAAPSTGSSKLHKRCDFDSATAPECWGDYSLSTNWYDEAPDTGVIREYWFDVQNGTAAPDGFERMVLTINGSLPGPTIFADWGDTVVVHVTNSLASNGTSIHFHGIRQLGTAQQDGVASITQCPVAPGDSMTYTWQASQYGTTWYHSHFSLQAWNGVLGGIVINGPASSPYDEDKGVLVLGDWYHQPSDELFVQASTTGPPVAQNGLINGTNVYNDGGARFETSVTAGTSYRLRLINVAMDTMFKFMIDNHTLTVISMDLVPIVPYETTSVMIGIGQRYDVIVTANQDPGNYYMRSLVQVSCSSTNENTLNIRGIFNYDTVAIAEPDTTGWDYVDSCADETDIVPFLALDADAAGVEQVFDVATGTRNNLVVWTLNGNPFLTDWGSPTLQQVSDGVTAWDVDQQIIQLDEESEWVYLVIESTIGITHPIHLHGHDFFVLQQGTGTFDASTADLNTVNPPRRDVAMLPGAGHLVMAFQTDNPGVWLIHCHIGWHTSQGFALQLVEQYSEIAATVDTDALDETCTNWNSYVSSVGLVQEDSGI